MRTNLGQCKKGLAMSDKDKPNNANLIPAGSSDLATVAAANSLVSRGVADLAKMRELMSAMREQFDLAFQIAINFTLLKSWLKPKNRFAFALDKLGRNAFRHGFRGGYIREYVRNIQESGRRLPEQFPFILSGDSWSRKGEHDKAIKDFDEAIRLDPRQAHSFQFRGMEWYSKQDYDKAISGFDQAIRLDPNKQFSYLNRGWAWCMKKEFDKAIINFDEAIRRIPNDALLFESRGEVWCFKQEFDSAIKDFDEAIRLGESGRSYWNRGKAWLLTKEYQRAFNDFNQAIRFSPDFGCAYVGRGTAWLGMRDYDKALMDFEEAIRLDPKNADAFGWIAWLLVKCPTENICDPKRAIQMAWKACELTVGGSGWQLDALAAAHTEAGQFHEAEVYQRMALNDPDYLGPEGNELRQRLEIYRKKSSGNPFDLKSTEAYKKGLQLLSFATWLKAAGGSARRLG